MSNQEIMLKKIEEAAREIAEEAHTIYLISDEEPGSQIQSAIFSAFSDFADKIRQWHT